MDSDNPICPVCTLYLRPGITLKSHLASHPKQKIIEALCKLSSNESQKSDCVVSQAGPSGEDPQASATHHGNHLFIYQQSMSTTGPQPAPVLPQYVIPAVFNSQMMPYVYQQQQVIMSSGTCMPPHPQARPLPFAEPPAQGYAGSGSEYSRFSPPSSVEMECNETVTRPPSSSTVHDLNKSREDEEEEEEEERGARKSFKDDCDLNSSNVSDPDVVSEDKIDCENDDRGSSPDSHSSNWSIKIRSDLNKACQTQNTAQMSPRSFEPEDNANVDDISPTEPDYYFPDQDEPEPPNNKTEVNFRTGTDTTEISSTYQHQESSTYAVPHHGDNLDYVEVDGVHVIINGFSSNHVLSQVENLDSNIKPEHPGVLMTIGGMVDAKDMSYSQEVGPVSMHADEHMPPRGELSGQESMGGASDITWNRIQYNEALSSSYDLIGRETWEASDSSDMDAPPPLQSRIEPHDVFEENAENNQDDAQIVNFSGPPLNFRCSTCGDAFQCLKDRKEHEADKHPDKRKSNLIGSEIGKKKVRKLVIKSKVTLSHASTEQPNFDNVFTNKLKVENGHEEKAEIESVIEQPIEVTPLDVKVVCFICDAVLPHPRALKFHKQQVHNVAPETRHQCATCLEAFPNDYKYTEHLRVHPLECRLCGKLFYRRQNIQLHMKRHLGIKPYKCEVCEKSFLTKQKHDEHRNTHTGEAPIKCSLCDETFRRHSNLVQHRNRHHLHCKRKVRDYVCACGEVFHSKRKLAWHKEVHDAKPKACAHCSEKFIHASSLTRHMRRAHNERYLPKEERSGENVECPICKGVYLRSSLDVHIRNHSGQRPYTCLICNKDFTTKWNLKLHKWTHASRTSKPFKCILCKGAFIRETDYVAHMNSHKSVRPFTCNYCGAQFIRKYNCQRHVREHETTKTFTCQVCNKAFHRSYYLKDHMRVHSGQRPYACHICGKTSATKSNHNKHVQIHHAREPVNTEN